MNLIFPHNFILQQYNLSPQITSFNQINDQQHHFCYFDIRNTETLITQSILLFLSFVLFLFGVKKYRDIWKSITYRNKNANLAYLAVMIWWLSTFLINSGFIAKDLYGILIYILYNSKDNVTQELSWWSKLYFTLDWFNAFVLQTLLIFVPYHWMRQISQALSVVSGGDSQSGIQQNFQNSHYKGIQSKLHPILRVYLLIRALSLIPLALFLILSDFNTVSLISKILLSILLFDCLMIIIILSLGIYSLKSNQLLRMQLDKDQSKRLLNQYLIIIICTGVRFAYDAFVVVYGATQRLTQDNCNLTSDVTLLALGMLIFTCIFTHYIPIIIILRIYTIEQQPEELTKSLIVVE